MRGVEVAFVGRLTDDPVQRLTKTGKTWLTFTVAVPDGEGDPQFVSVAAFGEKAAEWATRLVRGAEVYLEGTASARAWLGKDGLPRAGISVSTFHVVPLGQIGERRPRLKRRDELVNEPLPASAAPFAPEHTTIPF